MNNFLTRKKGFYESFPWPLRLVDVYNPLPNQTNLPMDCCPCDFLNDTFNELFGCRNISFPSDVGGKQLVKNPSRKTEM